jgi:hypothetical protein
LVEVFFDVEVDFVEVDEPEETPRPAPPLLGEPLEVSAVAGAASINAAASATTTSATGLRSTCVAREDVRYDKHNPFSFWCLRG